MPASPAVCPPREQLTAFALGHVSDADAGSIEAHLAACPACRQLVATTPADSLVHRLRDARPASESVPPSVARPAHDTALRDETVPPAASPTDVAGSLRDHSRYEIQEQLGAGGMGVVYKARHRLMNRTVAIKVINQGLAARLGALERFRREIEVAARLNHPNIATAFEAEKVGDLYLLVMEFIDGEDLAKIMQRKGPLPVRHACHFARQAALGLQHAHEQGLVHRDIKPANLMVTRGPKPQVKILDFGLGKLVSERHEDASLTGEGAVMGTPHYIAPEQAMDARTADIRADIYSLGCTLYHLLAGRPPFEGGSTMQVMTAHLCQPAPLLCEVRLEVPEELSALVARMMAKKPEQRPQTPDEVARALVPFLTATAAAPAGGAPTAVALASPATQVPPDPSFALSDSPRSSEQSAMRSSAAATPPARSRRRPLVLAAGGVMLLLAIGIGLWAAGVFRVKTKEGVLVVEVNEPGAEVFVDGEKVTVTWADGGKRAEISVKPGTRKVEVKKDGFTVHGEEVTVEGGGRKAIVARLEKAAEQPPRPKAPVAMGIYTVYFPQAKARASVELKADNTFTGIGEKGKKYSGTWEIRGELLVLQSDLFVEVWTAGEGRIHVQHWTNPRQYPGSPPDALAQAALRAPAEGPPVAMGIYTVNFPQAKIRTTVELKADNTFLVRGEKGKKGAGTWEVRGDLMILRGESFLDVWTVTDGRIDVQHWANPKLYPGSPPSARGKATLRAPGDDDPEDGHVEQIEKGTVERRGGADKIFESWDVSLRPCGWVGKILAMQGDDAK